MLRKAHVLYDKDFAMRYGSFAKFSVEIVVNFELGDGTVAT